MRYTRKGITVILDDINRDFDVTHPAASLNYIRFHRPTEFHHAQRKALFDVLNDFDEIIQKKIHNNESSLKDLSSEQTIRENMKRMIWAI